jgi:hypothetical protein
MNLIEITAPRRSGHHAMMSWVVENLTRVKISHWDYRVTVVGDSNFCVLNEGNEWIDRGIQLLEELKSPIDTLMINYEDGDPNYSLVYSNNFYKGKFHSANFLNKKITNSYKMLFIRDFYNNIASRYHANSSGHFPHSYTEEFIESWKGIARDIINKKYHFIKYEDWLTNSEIRNKFLLDVFGVCDTVGVKNLKGTGSSFGEHKNVMNRFDMVELPEEVKNLIRKDNELHYLIGALGYEYKEI